MATIVRIDNEVIDADSFVKILKLGGQFDGLLEQIVRDKVAVLAAKKHGIVLAPEEVQEKADQFRRANGLHRAADMNQYMDNLGITLDDFETFITDGLYQDKMMEEVGNEQAVEQYFKLNSPKFDSVEVSHIMLDTESAAKEMIAYLQDDPDSFAEMAREHSIADTKEQGGVIGKVLRGSLKSDVEAKIFNAAEGDLLGPFPSYDRSFFEIFTVSARHPAKLDEDTRAEIKRLLRDQWLMARAQEHIIETR